MVWASKRHGDTDRLRELAAVAYDRAFFPDGAPRQLAAIYASGDRSAALARLDVPTLVIHGRDDTLIAPDGGVRTAELIPTANLLLLADMGHDLPEPLWPVIVDTVSPTSTTESSRLSTVGAHRDDQRRFRTTKNALLGSRSTRRRLACTG